MNQENIFEDIPNSNNEDERVMNESDTDCSEKIDSIATT